MKITAVKTIPLRGATQDTGWPGGTDAHEQMNTLVEISTDEGPVGPRQLLHQPGVGRGVARFVAAVTDRRDGTGSRTSEREAAAMHILARAAAARWNMRSAAWTSRSGICWARP